MINIDKHTNIDVTVISITSKILEILKPGQSILFENAKDEVIKSLGSDADFNYLYALDLLYLLGIIEYNLTTNTIARL
jgi:hypothetical protein